MFQELLSLCLHFEVDILQYPARNQCKSFHDEALSHHLHVLAVYFQVFLGLNGFHWHKKTIFDF